MSQTRATQVQLSSQQLRLNLRKRRRIQHHVGLAVTSSLIILLIFAALQSGDAAFRLSMATAYTSLALLALTLLIGPWNVIRSRRNPVSSDFRRDVGIWTAITGVAHVVVGLQVHFRDQMWLYFVAPPTERGLTPIRFDWFGLANYTGLLATLSVVLLLGLSNDLAIRKLGRRRWKMLQRLNYVLFGVVALHGLLYQKVEGRIAQYAVILGVTVIGVAIVQAAGVHKRIRPGERGT